MRGAYDRTNPFWLASVSSQKIHTVVYPTDNRHFACNTTKVRFVKYQSKVVSPKGELGAEPLGLMMLIVTLAAVDKWISVSFDVPAAGDTNVCEMVSVDNRMGNMGRYGVVAIPPLMPATCDMRSRGL
ncbi:uncharacterized protein EI90DRAFT_3016301 [Cantharellus anzutake]|uniref:uncharacterized protein n=1 Tax=Cantharellus anzutake TaxID=1750568 RepID=UPI001907CBC4|nr:uncharacterized protein EI90DRAFT_3016301 [Cantharellus anzutake]KAF8331764.1 hypothetical protein EI90DRAFT_3016301 [Cantharellus anzutake]